MDNKETERLAGLTQAMERIAWCEWVLYNRKISKNGKDPQHTVYEWALDEYRECVRLMTQGYPHPMENNILQLVVDMQERIKQLV